MEQQQKKLIYVTIFLISIFILMIISVNLYSYNYHQKHELIQNNTNIENSVDNQNQDADIKEDKELSSQNNENKTSDNEFTEQEQTSDENKKESEATADDEEKIVNQRIENARKLYKEQKYESAIYELENITKDFHNSTTVAVCYEEIATIYANIKRYGKALDFAQKAYNEEATINREVLIARLQYKTGNIQSATIKMENILKKDFTDK